MRKECFAILMAVGLLLWGVSTAGAVEITWHVLTHDSIAGHGPGDDGLIGTEDDTTEGESNGCNYSPTDDCKTGPTPDVGTYTYAGVEMDGSQTHECVGGDLSGQPCLCADGETACTGDADCPGAVCAPADCCPGFLGTCLECAQDDPPGEPFGPPQDGHSYAGPSEFAPGTVVTCQEADPSGDAEDPPTEFEITAVDMGGNGPLPGFGGGCLELSPTGGPFLGTPCTGSGPISATFDVVTKALNCAVPSGTLEGVSVTGDIIDITDPDNPVPAEATCGYSNAQLKVIAGHAKEADPDAKHLMIICGGMTYPDTVDVPCMKNAVAYLAWVLYTTDDASACPDDGCQ